MANGIGFSLSPHFKLPSEAAVTCLHHILICHLPTGSVITSLEAFERSVGRSSCPPSLLEQQGSTDCPRSCWGCQNSEQGKTTSGTECSSQMRSITCCDTRLQSRTTALRGSRSTVIRQEQCSCNKASARRQAEERKILISPLPSFRFI